MSSFAYCPYCGEGVDKPSMEDDLRNIADCPHCTRRLPQYYTIEDWVIQMQEEIEELKKQLTGN